MNLFCKRITVVKAKEVKTGSNLPKFSKEGCDSRSAVLPLVMMKCVGPTSLNPLHSWLSIFTPKLPHPERSA
jgi:hypothetical protein